MMKDIFITSNNFIDYMNEAVNIYIATSYLNRFIIDNIKSNLEKLPFHGGRNFRFLLNQDFHEDPQMRQILVNMLLELPNTEVRIYKGDKFFHPKLYIFESGNNVFIAVGSFNATAGGAGKNIEAGVRVHDKEIYRQAKEFFDLYWDSAFTEIAVYDETATFVEKKFRPGDPVEILSRKEQGVIVNVEPEQYENEWHYSVFSKAQTNIYPESDLSHVRIWDTSHLDVDFNDTKISTNDWIKNYILEKVFSLPEKALASYGSSRTEIYPYQFRPLLKMIHSSEHRLLIADEVGMGKTIEAGIILKEFLFRMRMNRILIIVPNSLRTKWKDELRIRFDEYYDIVTRKDLLEFLSDYEKSPGGAGIKGIITYDQLASRKFKSYLNNLSRVPPFDMFIIDEAHHLKNEETIRHSVIKKLTRNSNALILLTATPIQIKTRDLYNLLTILLPKYSDNSRTFSVRLTLNERLMDAMKKLDDKKLGDFKHAIDEIQSTVAFRKQLEYFDNSEEIFTDCVKVEDGISEARIMEIRSKLYNLNVLSRYISRTLRKDVGLRFPERTVSTQVYEYSPQEKSIYAQIISNCQKYKSKNNRLVLVSIERQAASSLFAFYRDLKNTQYAKGFSEYTTTLEDVDDEGSRESAELDERQVNDLTANVRKLKLPEKDSKLKMLKEIIDGIFSNSTPDKDKKVLIFCTFLATIKYLKEHLSLEYPTVYIDTLTGAGDVDIDKRYEKLKTFSNRSPSILICSEIAGEGLDFQFCHYLINYDMPWNPSKLEQRVGRIDRIGQEAEKITIINLVNKYTIEDYIIAKLFERVKLFRSTLGPLGEVLGQYQNEFSTNVLKAERTEKEKEEYEKKVSAKLEDKRKEQQRFEESQVELFGILDYFYDEELKKNIYFTENEIKFLWDTFLNSAANVSYKDVVMGPDDDVFKLNVNDTLSQILNDMIERGISGVLNKRKKDHYISLVHNAAISHTPIRYTFNQRKALDDLSLEFLTITHPFINGALQYFQSDYQPNRAILFCRGAIPGLQPGTNLIFIYRFEIQGMEKRANHHHNEERTFIYSLQGKTGQWKSTDIINDLIGHVQEEEQNQDILSMLKKLNRDLATESRRVGEEILKDYSDYSIVDVERKRESLNAQYNTKIEQKKRNLQFTQDPYHRTQAEKEIEQLNSEKKQRLSEIETSQYRVIIYCSGIIVLKNEVVSS
jgi:SNF2 family DNA or RNA helicase